MKRLLLFCLLASSAFASFVVVYDQSSKRVTGTIQSADTLAYNRTGYLINPVIPTGFATNVNNFWVTNGVIQPVPQALLNTEAFVARSNQVEAAVAFAMQIADDTNALGRFLTAQAIVNQEIFTRLRLGTMTNMSKIQYRNAITNQIIIGK